MHLAEGILPLPHAALWSAAGAAAVLGGCVAWRLHGRGGARAPLAFASMSTAMRFAVTLVLFGADSRGDIALWVN